MEKRQVSELNILEKKLNSDLSEGLSAREARVRLEKLNKSGKVKSLFVPKRRSIWSSLLIYIGSPFTVLLMLISLMAAVFGRGMLGGMVFSIALAGAIFGGIVYLRAQRRLDQMREYASPMIRVKRGGNLFHTDGRNLVPGDVIVLSTGDLLPCDARIIKCESLVVDELISADDLKGLLRRRVAKNADDMLDEEGNGAVLAPNATNMLYAGSAVVRGSAYALVVAVGDETYLSDHVSEGTLGGKDLEPEVVKGMKPLVRRISFICACGLLLLSLVGLLTLNGKEEFICYFMMLLSAIFLITAETLTFNTKEIFSSYITRLSRNKSEKRKKDNSAAVRTVKAFDKLTDATDLIMFGTAGLYEGTFKVGSAFLSSERLEELNAEDEDSEIFLSFINTYVRAQRESGAECEFNANGISDALYAYLRNVGFDFSGASLAIRSLYFANDLKTGLSFACAETESSIYRVSLTFSEEAIKLCDKIRVRGQIRDLPDLDLKKIKTYCREEKQNNSACIICISEMDGNTVFEGVITMYQKHDRELVNVVKDMARFGITTSIILPVEDFATIRLINSHFFKAVFDKKIALASDFRKSGAKICEGLGEYSAYVGFTTEEYGELVNEMRAKGRKIISFGVSNQFNEVMAKTDVVATCDVIRYSSEKYRESVYERLPAEGRDTNLRASQQTRLLSKIIVKRSHEGGGGAYSLFKAVRMSRGAYVSIAQSMLLFALLSANLLSFCAMSVLTGNVLLDPLQAVALASVFTFLAATVFSDSEQKLDVIAQKRNYTGYPASLLKSQIPAIISRASVAFIAAIAIKILDVIGVFGENPVYTLPIYISLLLTMCFEVLIINAKHTKKGEGRSYCWIKVGISYAILLSITAFSTQYPLATELYKNGFGSFEYLIIPAYLALYGIALLVSYLINKKRNIN